jgi:hypothetical protein
VSALGGAGVRLEQAHLCQCTGSDSLKDRKPKPGHVNEETSMDMAAQKPPSHLLPHFSLALWGPTLGCVQAASPRTVPNTSVKIGTPSDFWQGHFPEPLEWTLRKTPLALEEHHHFCSPGFSLNKEKPACVCLSGPGLPLFI